MKLEFPADLTLLIGDISLIQLVYAASNVSLSFPLQISVSYRLSLR